MKRTSRSAHSFLPAGRTPAEQSTGHLSRSQVPVDNSILHRLIRCGFWRGAALALVAALSAPAANAAPSDPAPNAHRTAIVDGSGRGGTAIRTLLRNAAIEGRRRGYRHFIVVGPAPRPATDQSRRAHRDRVLIRFLDAPGFEPEVWNVDEILNAPTSAVNR